MMILDCFSIYSPERMLKASVLRLTPREPSFVLHDHCN
jgi:hypothetical protein